MKYPGKCPVLLLRVKPAKPGYNDKFEILRTSFKHRPSLPHSAVTKDVPPDEKVEKCGGRL